MAEPWALRHKRWKKQVYLALVEAKNLRRASCLHALSRPEISHLRDLAPWTPICFVPNGVDLAFSDDLPPRSALETDFPEIEGRSARSNLDRPTGGSLADHDGGALPSFCDRMSHLGLSDRMTYVGHVAGERARQVWAAADAFVLPSYSEGFSMAILEALACRLPSLITTACHFPEAAAAGGAVVVTPDVDAVTQGLRDLLDRTPDERARLGLNGRRLVVDRYTWDRQAERLASVYRWLRGGGPPPDVVVS